MDPLKLLARSTRRKKTLTSARDAPSGGQNAQPQLFPDAKDSGLTGSRKRKRNGEAGVGAQVSNEPGNFFARQEDGVKGRGTGVSQSAPNSRDEDNGNEQGLVQTAAAAPDLSHEDCRRILNAHKLKVTWLNPPRQHQKERRKAEGVGLGSKKSSDSLLPQPLSSFDELGSRYGVGQQLVKNVVDQGYKTPTEVQMAALPLLLEHEQRYMSLTYDHSPRRQDRNACGIDLLSVAPTGSGKTLAFMIPLIDRVRRRKRQDAPSEKHTSAVILAPTKELAAQIVNEGRKLSVNTAVRVTQMRKGMRLGHEQADDSASNGETGPAHGHLHDNSTVVKADIIVSTPGVLQSAVRGSSGMDHLAQVEHLVLDEADVLLDPLFKEQTRDIWNGLTHPELRISMWSATMGSNVEELARSTITARMRQLQHERDENFAEAPLVRLIVGLKDSAAPNVEHKLLYAASEQGKLMGLRQLLHPTSSSHNAGPTLRPPFLVFTQTIERAIALHSELRYDIPAEAGGISRIAVLHADLSTPTRDDVMTRFRKGSIWVLITTDLLSRGVDFRGVNGVVNYDIPGSSAAYIHRIGRTGRAGREGGVAVTLYSKEDMPYLKHIANVIAMAQRQRGEEASDMQKWLLDALPKLSKNEKQALRKHGVKSRASKGQGSDDKAARRTKISTKAGFSRRAENRRKGARAASQRTLQGEADSDAGIESDFTGFD